MSNARFDSIIISGEPYRLSGGVVVKTWKDPGGFSFPARQAGRPMPLMGSRRDPDKKKVKNLEQLKATVTQVVMHTDLTSDSSMCFRVLVDRGLSTHFMIDWDGVIYQGMDVLSEAYHAGEANNHTIGIDVNNLMRNFERESKPPPMYNPKHPRLGEMSQREYRRSGPIRKRINGYWTKAYGYTDVQYQALLELLKVLTGELDIKGMVPLDEIGEIVPTALEDGAGFEGIVGHWHLSTSRWDPGPAFDWQRVYHGLAREHNSFPVELEPGKNISTLLERKRVETYAERYFENIEGDERGGWYPLGRNQNWHGGIHLHIKEHTPVRAMFDGVLVAARFGKRPTLMGHNNFMVLRHEIDIPTSNKEKLRKLVFYSLYMHLAPMDVVSKPDPKTALTWIRKLHEEHGREEETTEAALKIEREDGEDEEGLFDEDADEESESYDTKGYLEVGHRLAAFKREQLALVPWQEDPITIRSGDVIGHVGEFGPPDDWDHTLHVEIFAERGWEKAIDLGTHGRYFVEIEGDLGDDLFVENRELLSIFADSSSLARKGSLVPKRVVDPDAIEDFFTSTRDPETLTARRRLRMAVTRHVSEWSDQVDWVKALSAAEEWDDRTKDFKKIIADSGIFKGALLQVLPFIWLSRDVATHIGLSTETWDGVVYHFHPIHFLWWLTYRSSQRLQAISRGLSLRKLKARKRKEESRRKKERIKESEACLAAAIDLADIDVAEVKGELNDLLEQYDQGEWTLSWEEDD
jgi:N-acetylmuramoyl-L-alanine amidase